MKYSRTVTILCTIPFCMNQGMRMGMLVFSVVMMMNMAVNKEEERKRNAEERTVAERTAVQKDKKQEHEKDRFDLRREAVCVDAPSHSLLRVHTVYVQRPRTAAASTRSGV